METDGVLDWLYISYGWVYKCTGHCEGTGDVCIYVDRRCVNKNIVKPPVMCNLSRTNMLTNIHTHAEKETDDFTRYKHAVNANIVWTSRIWQEKKALRNDPNNHQNKVRRLSGTVQGRSIGNWTGYEKCVFLLSTAHFDVSYRPEMNGK